jgi:hypothetical protein
MNKKLKAIPKFRSEEKERRFWQTHDSSDYIDWTKAARARFPNSQAVNDCDLATPASDASRTMPLMSGPLTIDENGGGPGVRLQKRYQKKS